MNSQSLPQERGLFIVCLAQLGFGEAGAYWMSLKLLMT
jgi:hypothetical protein